MRGFAPFLLLVCCASFALAGGVRRDYTLTIADGPASPDGYRRNAVTVNDITPGPILTGFKGDTLMVNVRNRLNNLHMRRSTTVHWHGILQTRNAFDDGPAGVTQCPIAPGHDYEYRVEVGDQAGTFWYHSHLSSQYIDGLRGALIIYDRDDPHDHLYDVDDESTVIGLTDWYHNYTDLLIEDWVADKIPEPCPDSTLLNGIGRYKGGKKVQRAVITVQKGLRYRFRLINMSAIVPFKFAIEGHSLTVIEADGVSHKPLTVPSLSIAAGQRYSVVVNADKEVANYWVAYPSTFVGVTETAANPNYNGTDAFAIFHYMGAPEAEPETPELAVQGNGAEGGQGALEEYQLKPLENPTPPGGSKADVVVQLNFTTPKPGDDVTPGVGSIWEVNGVKYTSPKIPTLLAILRGVSTGDDSYALPINKSIEVQLRGDEGHPFHLHGHTFSVIQSATGPRNVIDPPIRDTVDTSNDIENPVTIRFQTDNPGPWFLHCHKDWHLEAGLAVVFIEDKEGQREELDPPQEWDELCDIYNALPPGLQ